MFNIASHSPRFVRSISMFVLITLILSLIPYTLISTDGTIGEFSESASVHASEVQQSDQHIAFVSNRNNRRDIYVMNTDGSEQTALTSQAGDNWDPAWSPDGTRIAFASNRTGNYDIYVMNADGSGQVNLTSNAAEDARPAWSPDGTRIAFASNRTGNYDIYVMNADGSGQVNLTNPAQRTAADERPPWSSDAIRPSWSPDGTTIAFSSDRDGSYDVYTINLDGSGLTKITTESTADEVRPAWSPDGTTVAFVSNRDGNNEIYVVDVDGSEITRLTTHNEADENPAWSPDGTLMTFHSNRDGNYEIYTMRADGSEQTNLTNHVADDGHPAWSGSVVATAPTATPTSATTPSPSPTSQPSVTPQPIPNPIPPDTILITNDALAPINLTVVQDSPVTLMNISSNTRQMRIGSCPSTQDEPFSVYLPLVVQDSAQAQVAGHQKAEAAATEDIITLTPGGQAEYVFDTEGVFCVIDVDTPTMKSVVTVQAGNGAPQTYAVEVTLSMNDSISVTLPLEAASDPDNDLLTFELDAMPAHGVAAVVTDTLMYQPNENYTGIDSLTYMADDGHGHQVQGQIDFVVLAPTTPPLTSDRVITIGRGESASLDLSNLVHDPENRTLTYSLAVDGDYGVASVTQSNLEYRQTIVTTHTGVFTDSVIYAVESDQSEQAVGAVVIRVVPEAGDLVANDRMVPLYVNEQVSVDLAALVDNPAGDALTFGMQTTLPISFDTQLNGSVLSFTPATDYSGLVGVDYVVTNTHNISDSGNIVFDIHHPFAPDPQVDTARPVRLVIEPASRMFTAVGQSQTFTLVAYNSQGGEVPVDDNVSWLPITQDITRAMQIDFDSSNPSQIKVTARGDIGYVQLKALWSGMPSRSAAAMSVQLRPDVISINDSAVLQDVEFIMPAELEALETRSEQLAWIRSQGSAYRMPEQLKATVDTTQIEGHIQVGSLIMSEGIQPIFGQIISTRVVTNGTEIIYGTVPVQQIIAAGKIRGEIHTEDMLWGDSALFDYLQYKPSALQPARGLLSFSAMLHADRDDINISYEDTIPSPCVPSWVHDGAEIALKKNLAGFGELSGSISRLSCQAEAGYSIEFAGFYEIDIYWLSPPRVKVVVFSEYEVRNSIDINVTGQGTVKFHRSLVAGVFPIVLIPQIFGFVYIHLDVRPSMALVLKDDNIFELKMIDRISFNTTAILDSESGQNSIITDSEPPDPVESDIYTEGAVKFDTSIDWSAALNLGTLGAACKDAQSLFIGSGLRSCKRDPRMCVLTHACNDLSGLTRALNPIAKIGAELTLSAPLLEIEYTPDDDVPDDLYGFGDYGVGGKLILSAKAQGAIDLLGFGAKVTLYEQELWDLKWSYPRSNAREVDDSASEFPDNVCTRQNPNGYEDEYIKVLCKQESSPCPTNPAQQITAYYRRVEPHVREIERQYTFTGELLDHVEDIEVFITEKTVPSGEKGECTTEKVFEQIQGNVTQQTETEWLWRSVPLDPGQYTLVSFTRPQLLPFLRFHLNPSKDVFVFNVGNACGEDTGDNEGWQLVDNTGSCDSQPQLTFRSPSMNVGSSSIGWGSWGFGGGGGSGGFSGSGCVSGYCDIWRYISSWGDPHNTTFDGGTYTSVSLGEFIYARDRTNPDGLELQVRQGRLAGFPDWAGFNTAAAMRADGHVFEVRLPENDALSGDLQLLIDGRPADLSPGLYQLGSVALRVNADNSIALWTAIVDPANPDAITDDNTLLVEIGALSQELSGASEEPAVGLQVGISWSGNQTLPLHGMLGSPDNDVSNDFTGRQGEGMGSLDAFFESWRITERAESLFTYEPGEGPETFNLPQTGTFPGADDLAGLTGGPNYIQQATDLMIATCQADMSLVPPAFIEDVAIELAAGRTEQNLVASGLCFDPRVAGPPEELIGFRLYGQVTLQDQPEVNISGTRVVIRAVELGNKVLCDTVTVAHGRYECHLTDYPDDYPDMLTLQYEMPGYGEAVAATAQITPPLPGNQVEHEQNLVANPGIIMHLTGTLFDPAGLPLPNGHIRITQPAFASYTTDETGRYDFYLPLPEGMNTGNIVYEAAAADMSTYTQIVNPFDFATDGVVEVALDITTENRAVPDDAVNQGAGRQIVFTGMLDNRLVQEHDSSANAGIANTPISIQSSALDGGVCETTTDSQGRYTCSANVEETDFTASVVVAGLGETEQQITVGAANIPPVGSSWVKTTDLTIAPTTLLIEGTVTDPAGSVVAGAEVQATSQPAADGSTLAATGTTGTQGEYTLYLALPDTPAADQPDRVAGVLSFDVSYETQAGRSLFATTRDLNTLSGGAPLSESLTEVRQDLQFSGYTLAFTGRVHNGLVSGYWVAGADVRITDAANDLLCETRTDERGYYACDVFVEGSDSFTAHYEVSRRGIASLETTVDLSAAEIGGRYPVVQSFTVEPATLYVTGLIKDRNGNPIVGAQAALVSGNSQSSAQTDGQGRYELYLALDDGVTTGEVRIAGYYSNGVDSNRQTTSVPFTIDNGQLVSLSQDITLDIIAYDPDQASHVRFSGQVRNSNANGAPLVGVRVVVTGTGASSSVGTICEDQTNSNGQYSCEAIIETESPLEAQFAVYRESALLDTPINASFTLAKGTDSINEYTKDVSIAPTTLMFQGQVIGRNDIPLQSAYVQSVDTYEAAVTTDENGRFAIMLPVPKGATQATIAYEVVYLHTGAQGSQTFTGLAPGTLNTPPAVTINVPVNVEQVVSIQSSFDTDREDWTTVNEAPPLDYMIAGGNPGGHICASYSGAGAYWYFQAPTKFLGDISNLYNNPLTFELKRSATDGSGNDGDDALPTATPQPMPIPTATPQPMPIQIDAYDALLIGDNTTLGFRLTEHPGTEWTRYSVVLNEFGWINTATGQNATQAEMIAVLSSLDGLWIRGEYDTGTATTCLDNIGINVVSGAVEFDNFADLSMLWLNGESATINRPSVIFGGQPVLRFTNADWQFGSAFLNQPVCLVDGNVDTSFSTEFQFQITNPRGIGDDDGAGGDGMAFVIATTPDVLGNSGDPPGYANINPSVAVEIDTYRNPGDVSGNHVGVNLNGERTSLAAYAEATRLNNEAIWYVWIDYDGDTHLLEVRVAQSSTRPEVATVSTVIDIAGVLGQSVGFVGFTASTGRAVNEHDVRMWNFYPSSRCQSIP